MTFQGLAARAQGVFTGTNSAIRKEFTEVLSADRAVNIVSPVNKGEHLKCNPGDPLKIFTGNIPYDEGYNSFHKVPKIEERVIFSET